jgi:RimJ/RimL family protein N-acetyltransferase
VVELIALKASDFDWLANGLSANPNKLALPPDGIDAPSVLTVIRRMIDQLEQADCKGAWMIVFDGEVVGICSYKAPPQDGRAEVGYGIAASRRRRGYATAAVSAMIAIARQDPELTTLTAETVNGNISSERVLEKNGFKRTERCEDAGEGTLAHWVLRL